MSTTWYDSDIESEEEMANKVMALIGKYDYDSEFSDKEITMKC